MVTRRFLAMISLVLSTVLAQSCAEPESTNHRQKEEIPLAAAAGEGDGASPSFNVVCGPGRNTNCTQPPPLGLIDCGGIFSSSVFQRLTAPPLSQGPSITGCTSNPPKVIATKGGAALANQYAIFKPLALNVGYWNVELLYPIHTSHSSCVSVRYKTTPLRAVLTAGSKTVTLKPEFAGTSALPGNDINVGDPVEGTGIPTGTTVTSKLARFTTGATHAPTFMISKAATSSSPNPTAATGGTALTITRTFSNKINQKAGASGNLYTNGKLQMKPSSSNLYVWVPPAFNSPVTSSGSLTVSVASASTCTGNVAVDVLKTTADRTTK